MVVRLPNYIGAFTCVTKDPKLSAHTSLLCDKLPNTKDRFVGVKDEILASIQADDTDLCDRIEGAVREVLYPGFPEVLCPSDAGADGGAGACADDTSDVRCMLLLETVVLMVAVLLQWSGTCTARAAEA